MGCNSDLLRADRDFAYNGKDRGNFIRCCLCQCYTPFIVYIVSRKALDLIKLGPQHNFFCAKCIPKSLSAGDDALFPPGSLLNNHDVMTLFKGYEYQNPYYDKYFTKNRLIITEDSKIHASYKKVIRKPLPANVKLEKIYQLFPPVHQMPFKKYPSSTALYTELRQKIDEISREYNETNSTREFYDNIDVMIDRTPLQIQTARNRSWGNVSEQNPFPSDVYEMRSQSMQESVPSDGEVLEGSLIQYSSQSLSISNASLLESQRSRSESQNLLPESQNLLPESQGFRSESQNLQPENQQLQPKSQNLQPESQHSRSESQNLQPESQRSRPESQNILPQSQISLLSLNISSQEIGQMYDSDGSLTTVVSASPLLVTSNRPLQGVSDSQEAGPSGLQQQRDPPEADPQAKRRRMSTPVNPSPEEARAIRGSRVRLPRLSGG